MTHDARIGLSPHPVTDATSDLSEPSPLLHAFFARSVRLWPTRVAVDAPPGIGRPSRRLITYRELDRQSDGLARTLEPWVGPDCTVGILLPRGSELLYTAQLGVLKSGAAFVCLDPSFPDGQMRDVLGDAQPVALLTDAEGTARARQCGHAADRVIDLAGQLGAFERKAESCPSPPWLTPHRLAYIIYTSGTTGRPKGVMVEHASISNLVAADLGQFGVSPDDRVAQNSSPAYDSSLEEIWLALAAGAALVPMDENTARLGPDLVSWLRRERITVFCPPPTQLRTTGCADPASALPALRFVYVGGEALPTDVADTWARGRLLVNGYGPTECTVTALRGQVAEGERVSIGIPAAGVRAWVLDDRLEPVEDGARGELCLGGACLARGYHKSPELTAQKFPVHPALGRIYRSGDLVHREADGRFYYHGRIDTQVKVRGYRIELEAIETRLSEHAGVREAACAVQGGAQGRALIAFVVPVNPQTPPATVDLQAFLSEWLPPYMVPARIGILPSLPTTLGGKLDRHRLPALDTGPANKRQGAVVAPRTAIESRIDEAFRSVLRLAEPPSVHDDFFRDLGGDSLLAAQVVSRLRDEADTSGLTVRDVYEAPTIAGLAGRAGATTPEATDRSRATSPVRGPRGTPVLATLVQAACLVAGIIAATSAAYLLTFRAVPAMLHALGLVPAMLLGPLVSLAALVIYTPVALLFAVAVKRLLIGRYRPLRAPAWSSFYVRNWIVQRVVRTVPWWLLEGTVFQQLALRALGARIGRRVHIHRGVNMLQGGWDLLTIGDDVSIGQDASVTLVDLDDGDIVVAPISLGAGATVEVRAGISGGASLDVESMLTALSALLPGSHIGRGERWDGIPAAPAGDSPVPPRPADGERRLSPLAHGIVLVLARYGLGTLRAAPVGGLLILSAVVHGLSAGHVLDWLAGPSLSVPMLETLAVVLLLSAPLKVALELLVMRALGPVPEGVISRWSLAYVRVWLKTGLLQSAGDWLSGTVFWPAWLRRAGMTIGGGCEISTITDVVPELVEIGAETFFADGIYLAGPRVHRGTVTLARTSVGSGCFAGNHAVIGAGQHVGDGVLIGVSTAADDTVIRPGTSWFGQPPFELPRREIVACDRRLTHDPTPVRYVTRVFWEMSRSVLPVLPGAAVIGWLGALAALYDVVPIPLLLLCVIPCAAIATGLAFCGVVLALKWLLLGRVRPGMHPFWSCWCSRWDFLYVAWRVYARPSLSALEGTLLLTWYLRAMGAKIGRGVLLGGGFAQVVDPDMLHFEDGSTVCCQFQAHTFEDRVLKIDHVWIRHQATVASAGVLLYGADVGAGTRVAPHSVIMKHERLLPGRTYAGCPSRQV
jgi:non-ribosomal peptide synthetase-like protein